MLKFLLFYLLVSLFSVTQAEFTWLGEWKVLSSCPSYCCCPLNNTNLNVLYRPNEQSKIYAQGMFEFNPFCTTMGITLDSPFIYFPWRDDTFFFDESIVNSFNKKRRDVYRYVEVKNITSPYKGYCAFIETDQSKAHFIPRGICPFMMCKSETEVFVNQSAQPLDARLSDEFNVEVTDYDTFMKYWPSYELRKFSMMPYQPNPLIPKIFHVLQLETFGSFRLYNIERTRALLSSEWTVKIWTDENLRRLFEPYQEFLDNVRLVDMKYNLAALLVLRQEGGVLISPDAYFIKDLDELVHRYDYFIQAGFSNDDKLMRLFVNNQIFGAKAAHPFLQETIEIIISDFKNITEQFDSLRYSEFCQKFFIKNPAWFTNYGGPVYSLSLATTMWPYSYVYWKHYRDTGNFIALSRTHFQPFDIFKPSSAAFGLYNFFNLSSLHKLIDFDTGNLQVDSKRLSTPDSQKFLLFSWNYHVRNLAVTEPHVKPLIPKILHLYMKEFSQEIIDTWQRVNKLWKIQPHVEDPLKWRCSRYKTLSEEGGVVVDGDKLFPLYEMDELVHKYSFFGAIKNGKTRVLIDDTVLGAKPNHMIITEAYKKTCTIEIEDIAFLTLTIYEKHDLSKNIVLPSGYFYGKDEYLDCAFTKLWIKDGS